MSECIYLKKYYSDTNDATSKSRMDTYTICDSMQFTAVDIGKYSKNKIQKSINLLKFYLFNAGLLFCRSKKICFINYPDFYTRINTPIFFKKCSVIALIHDIDHLRRKDLSIERKEIEYFNKCTFVFVHNNVMKNYLIEKGVDSRKILIIGLFDSLVSTNQHNNKRSFDLCFAGNLGKSAFIKCLDTVPMKSSMIVYGNNGGGYSKLAYGGSIPSDIVHLELNAKYGLVWDGDDICTCTGNYGEYLRFNNSYKICTYILAEKPILIWNECASFEWIKKYKIGVGISNLTEIDAVLNSISQDEYENMVKNMRKVKDEISTGQHLRSVLSRCIQILNGREKE